MYQLKILTKVTIINRHHLVWMIGISALILFACSSIRHALFNSNAFDLGIFDNGIYLISQGKEPYVTFRGLHILGDHGAFIFYPLALLYKIYPDVHWLFAVQAIALALAALPTWQLARQAGLKEAQATIIAVVYLLYPLIFNINLFDFHPEVIAVPAILWAVLAARVENLGGFILAIIVTLSCKAVLSLTVAAMGFWLLIFEKKRWYGVIALAAGLAWFLIATQLIIPIFSGGEAAAVSRYSFLGNSVFEIITNLILKPGIILSKLFTWANLQYILFVILPILWGISLPSLTQLIPTIPALALNLITDYEGQKDLVNQYSLPILPFLILAVIATLAAGKGWLPNPRFIIIWSLVGFLALAKFGYFGSIYLEQLDTWQATREAVNQIKNTQGSILTASQIAPHLTHRTVVKLASDGSESIDLNQFEYALLNLRHPGWSSSHETVTTFLKRLQQTSNFKLIYEKDDVVLFKKTA
jgi:uncharacterized membrane protein